MRFTMSEVNPWILLLPTYVWLCWRVPVWLVIVKWRFRLRTTD